MAEKRKPQRMCVGCGEMKAKTELLRVVRTPSGEVIIDSVGKAQGRGAYICKCAGCFAKARKSGRLSHCLAATVSEEIYTKLESEIVDFER